VLLSDASEAVERLKKYSDRLAEVRQRRTAMAAALAAAEAEAAAEATGAAGDQDDLVSEAPSMISGFSIYTEHTMAAGPGASGAGSSAVSSHTPSTVGGKKAMKNAKRAAKKGSRKIKAGSAGEEVALEEHLLSLAPAGHVLEEAGQLAELLVMLQHIADATKLQQRVGQWQAAAAEAAAMVAQGRTNQQQQQQQQGRGGAQQGPPSGATAGAAGGTAAAGSSAAAMAAAASVHWKWDVLREHK